MCSRHRFISAGFVRGYAKLLKLDVPQIMAALEAELAQTTKFAEPPPLAEHPHSFVDFLTLQLSKVDWRKGLIGLGAVIVLVAAVSVWVAWRHHNPLKGLKPGGVSIHARRVGRHVAVARAGADGAEERLGGAVADALSRRLSYSSVFPAYTSSTTTFT